MFHTGAFFQKDLFLLGCTLLLVVCHKWYRWLGVEVDLQMRRIFEVLYCLLISRHNLLLRLSGSRFLWLFYFCLVWRVVWCKSFLDIFFRCFFLGFLYPFLNVSVWLCLLLVVYRGSLFLYVLWMYLWFYFLCPVNFLVVYLSIILITFLE